MHTRAVIRRAGFAAAALGIGLVGFMPAAGATSPNRTPTSNPDFTFVGFCSFPVAFHAIVNNEFTTTTTLPDGTTISKTTGNLVASFTNTLNGNSITLNISGPGTFTQYPNGTAAATNEGLTSFFFNSQDQTAFGLPGLQYSAGLIRSSFDASGNLTSYSHSGSATDECAALA